MRVTENTEKLKDFIAKKFESNELDNDSLVQLIELCGSYLNLRTIQDYANQNNTSYNGAKKHRNIRKVLGIKFVIDND